MRVIEISYYYGIIVHRSNEKRRTIFFILDRQRYNTFTIP